MTFEMCHQCDEIPLEDEDIEEIDAPPTEAFEDEVTNRDEEIMQTLARSRQPIPLSLPADYNLGNTPTAILGILLEE